MAGTPPPSSPPVIVVEKKRGGCFNCGCGVLLVIIVLFAVLVGGGGYLLYKKGVSLTSPTASTIPTFDGGDAVYRAANQKLTAFNQNLATSAASSSTPGENPPSTPGAAATNVPPASSNPAPSASLPNRLELSADEINTLIARDPDLAANDVHLFVTFGTDDAQIQTSLPTRFVPLGLLKDRYFNASVNFTPVFDPTTKNLTLTLHHIVLGSSAVPPDALESVQAELNAILQTELQQIPQAKQFLDHAKTISIRNGKLILEVE